jgi:thiamine-phosphate kinase
MGEFELIRRHLAGLLPDGEGVELGPGDDCALLRPPPGELLALSTDTLIAGRHFPLETAPGDIGWKSLAVNLSDLAATGARPLWCLLALSLPAADEPWLAAFGAGFAALGREAGIALVGGDLTRGPLSIGVTVAGAVDRPLCRSGARAGDLICVSGTLGDAALALQRLQQHAPVAVELRRRLDRPQPRLAAGRRLREFASAAIDLSDGLLGDLHHVLEASGVGATLEIDRLPGSAAFAAAGLPVDERRRLQAAGGDDYELCCCLPPERLAVAQAALAPLPLTPVGRIKAQAGLQLRDGAGQTLKLDGDGYRHF